MNEHHLTPNQAYALRMITPGRWFYPDDSADLINIHSRNNTCRILAEQGYLVQRPVNRYGQIEMEYMLRVAKAIEKEDQYAE